MCEICSWSDKYDKAQELFKEGLQTQSPEFIAESGDLNDELLEEAREILLTVRDNAVKALDALEN
jgi:hypothetical protein